MHKETRRALLLIPAGLLTIGVVWGVPAAIIGHESYGTFAAGLPQRPAFSVSDDQTTVFMGAMHEPGDRDEDLIDDGSFYCLDRSMGDDSATARQNLIDEDDLDPALASRIAAAAVLNGSLCPKYR